MWFVTVEYNLHGQAEGKCGFLIGKLLTLIFLLLDFFFFFNFNIGFF